MNAAGVLGIALAVVSLGATAFSVDGRYLHQTEATHVLERLARDDERSTLETRLELAQLKLKLLLNLSTPTPDEQAEIGYLKDSISEIRKRLNEINRTRVG